MTIVWGILAAAIGGFVGAAAALRLLAESDSSSDQPKQENPDGKEWEKTLKTWSNGSDRAQRAVATGALTEIKGLRNTLDRSFDQAFTNWSRWSKDIQEDTIDVDTYRQVWRHIKGLYQSSPALRRSSFFSDYLNDTFATYCLTFVRRQVDSHSRSASLYRLLDDLCTYAHSFTREWYVQRNAPNDDPDDPGFLESHANECFDDFAGGHDSDHLSVRMLLDDRDRLKRLGDKSARYVTARIAHRADRPHDETISWKELDAVIDEISSLVRKYFLLLHFGTLGSTQATILGPWKGVFREPWDVSETEWTPPEAND